jgi:crossover junction endodeoxyribonuclease RusA
MYYNTRRGGKRLTKQAEDYIRISKAKILEAVESQKWIKQKKSTWYYMDLVFYMPDRRIRDSHNMLKLLLDVMQGVVYHNDYYVLPNIKSVEYDNNNPHLCLCIYPQSEKDREKALNQFKQFDVAM